MTKNRIKSAIVLQTVIALTIPSFSYAFKGIPKTTETGNSGQSSGNVVHIPSSKDEGTTIEGEQVNVCAESSNPSASKYFPLRFFEQISRNGSGVKIELKDDNKIDVKFPSMLNVCGEFKAVAYQNDVTKNVSIMIKKKDPSITIEYSNTNEAGETVKTTKTYGDTYGDYEQCLKDQKILVNNSIDHKSVNGSFYSQYSNPLGYKFDKSTDITKAVTLTYAHPKAFDESEDYQVDKGDYDDSVSLKNGCLGATRLAKNSNLYLNEGRDQILKRINDACKANNAQAIENYRKSIGNYDALSDIADKVKLELDAAILRALLANEVPAIYKKMDSLEDKINLHHNEWTESEAKKYIKQYEEQVKELDTKFLNPAIYHLNELIAKRADLKDEDPAIEGIDKEIKGLNEEIAKFAARRSTSLINLYELMKKYNISDSAKVIEDVRLKSFLYSKVFISTSDRKEKPITFADAHKKNVDGMTKFDKTLVDWQDIYLASNGSLVPIKKVQAYQAQTISRMRTRWDTYAQNEQRQYYQYCGTGMTGGVSNPIQCQTFLKGAPSRRAAQEKIWKSEEKNLRSSSDKLKEMGIGYNDYKTKQDEEKAQAAIDGVGPAGGSDSTFEEQFPQYATGSSANYDTWQYSPQNPAMNMGGYNPQGLQTMYNPGYAGPGAMQGMTPQGGYAYQMQPQGMYR